MAPGRMRKWLRLLPVQSGSHPHHARQSDTSNSASSSTEATATIVASDLTRNVVNLVPPQIETTSQAATSSEPVYRLNSKMAEEYMKKIKRFRILVMGRANAGKTTILQRVCNSTDKPEIFDGMGNKIDSVVVQGTLAHGYHDIKHELVFRSNPGFLFHDSCGFEAGSTQQFDQMKDFVVGHAAARSVKERIHAIWFCIPMTDYHRTVTAAEQKFFDECDTGHVPVIVLVTKADALHLDAIQELEDGGLEIEEAEKKLTQQEGELLENRLAYIKHNLDKCKFPPRGYVVLEKMDEESANTTTLMQCTANMLSEEGLQRLLVSTQQSTITLCVEYAVKKTLRRRMELGLKDRLQINVKRFEYDLLGWFPNCGEYLERHPLLVPLLDHLQEYRPQGHKQRQGGYGHPLHENGREEQEYLLHIDELSKFDVDISIPMPPLPKDVTLLGKFPSVQSMAEHAIGCLLVAEHSYFLMQHQHHVWQEALTLAVQEYKASNILRAVSKAVEDGFHDHNGDMDGLCEAIITVIIENRMSNKLLKEPDGN